MGPWQRLSPGVYGNGQGRQMNSIRNPGNMAPPPPPGAQMPNGDPRGQMQPLPLPMGGNPMQQNPGMPQNWGGFAGGTFSGGQPGAQWGGQMPQGAPPSIDPGSTMSPGQAAQIFGPQIGMMGAPGQMNNLIGRPQPGQPMQPRPMAPRPMPYQRPASPQGLMSKPPQRRGGFDPTTSYQVGAPGVPAPVQSQPRPVRGFDPTNSYQVS